MADVHDNKNNTNELKSLLFNNQVFISIVHLYINYSGLSQNM